MFRPYLRIRPLPFSPVSRLSITSQHPYSAQMYRPQELLPFALPFSILDFAFSRIPDVLVNHCTGAQMRRQDFHSGQNTLQKEREIYSITYQDGQIAHQGIRLDHMDH
ncbi:uncharacterized protein PV09_02235 [Verruconis gallopava]|uniref:Uncharacterized protein n=1 Tax=Verruconis gallopava TaxID=253628 RepID=A0A0D1Z371_9PEZI|nr:uncharacterized protein PV09_02235 [Verruconis gallopava]KIW07392.1 hypothetical protein PV09_02235 [Verruconis gallopava]